MPTIDEILPLTTEKPPAARRGFLNRQKSALELFHKIKSYKSEEQSPEDDEAARSDEEDKIKIEDYYDYGDDVAAGDSDKSGDNRAHNLTELLSPRTERGGGLKSGAYDDYGDYSDNVHLVNSFDVESLQSVESEHLDSFYRSKKHKLSLHLLDTDYDEGR